MALLLYLYHFIAVLVTSLFGLFLYRMRKKRPVILPLVLGILLLFGLALAAITFPIDGFARIQLLAWEAFVYFPIFLLMGIAFFWAHNRGATFGLVMLFLASLVVCIDSFLIEPQWLEITRMEISSSRLEEPLTIAILADIQTDSPGDYEKEVLEIIKENNPDLILLAGDYIQERDLAKYQRNIKVLNQIFHEGELSPRLGIYAVRGNVDRSNWGDVFLNLDVTLFEEIETVDLGPISLTGIGWLDSADPTLQIEGSEKFHIVLGHSPNFSLGEIDGDLLLAGHTHGGQVQLPGLGPLLTISVVPRSWASGLTEIEPGKYLLVSRGIGLERGYAPRMRFLCRPELILLDLVPEE